MWKKRENKNDTTDKQEKPFVVLISCFALIVSSIVFIFVQMQKQSLSELQSTNSHQAHMAEVQFAMHKQAALAESKKNAPAGYNYDGLVKNEFGFWEDENGLIYEVEFNEGIDVVSPLGKLSKKKQRALQKEKKEKENKIAFHKQELESLGVEIDKKKKKTNTGIPTYDARIVSPNHGFPTYDAAVPKKEMK